jgi:hypothetical protein
VGNTKKVKKTLGGYIMEKDEDKLYAPKERNYLEQNPKKFKSYSGKTFTDMPDPVEDSIVCQNIASQEFDYTSNELLEDTDEDKDKNK